MDALSPLTALAALCVALATTALIAKIFGAPPEQGRFAAIDGLRGYLAFFVFLHHGSVWYFYLRTGRWELPPSQLYTHFGQSSVALFFMITGFLFFSKLLDGRTRGVDWTKLFVSRFMRLVPLYLFAMLLLFLIVAVLSHGTLNQPLAKVVKTAMRWLGFTILGAPDLNGVAGTAIIIAKVTWSLPYEWFFYFALPILALTVGVRPPLPIIVLGIAGVLAAMAWSPPTVHWLAFAGGITAALLVRLSAFRDFARTGAASCLVLLLIIVTVTMFTSAYGVVPLVLLSAAFSLIAAGNGLFGSLLHPVSRTLGEMAYSIYLLHGIMLFVIFNFIVGADLALASSPAQHGLLMVAATPLLVLMSFCTFRLIEQPAMQSTKGVTDWLRSRAKRAAMNPV